MQSTRTCRHDLHSTVFYLAIEFQLCATNQQLQSKKEGKLRPTKLLKQKAFFYIYKANMVKTCFPCRRYSSKDSRVRKSTACSLKYIYIPICIYIYVDDCICCVGVSVQRDRERERKKKYIIFFLHHLQDFHSKVKGFRL